MLALVYPFLLIFNSFYVEKQEKIKKPPLAYFIRQYNEFDFLSCNCILTPAILVSITLSIELYTSNKPVSYIHFY